MKRLYLLGVIMTLLFSASCSKDISDEPSTGSIEGSVSDRTTGEPVSVVNVTLTPGGNSTVTGSDGTFRFRDIEAGSYTLQINKEGYKDNTAKVYVRIGSPTSAHLVIERIPGIVTADRETLDFGDNQSLNTLSFNIVNSSYEDLEWEIEERCEWITEVKPAKGTLKYGKTEGIVVVIDRQLLNTGENKAVIVIRSSQGSSELNVKATGAKRLLPSLNTLAPTNVTSSTATFNAEIVDAGTPAYTERGFVYSLTSTPTMENSIAKLTCPVNTNKSFSYNVTGLKYGQTYYVRAYAKNSVGVAYSSNQITVKPTATMPAVTTLDIAGADMSKGTATFRGQITNIGNPAYTERGFVYSTMPEPTIYDEKIVANGAGEVGSFSKYVTGLPKKTYYVRAYATGLAGTTYGEEKAVSTEWIEVRSVGIAVQKEDLGAADWYTAKSMCERSRVGGSSDWRLPTKEELMELYNNRIMIGGFAYVEYWSSSVTPYSFYYINFYDGNLSYCSSSYKYRVRAVRTLK